MRSKELLKKVTCAALAGVMLFGMAACKKNNQTSEVGQTRRGQKISADDVWYNAKVTELDVSSILGGVTDLDYQSTTTIGVAGDYCVVSLDAQRRIPDDFDWEKDDYTEYIFNYLLCLDLNDYSIVQSIDINENSSDSTYYSNYAVSGDKITATKYTVDSKTYDTVESAVEIDPSTGEITEVDNPVDSDILEEIENSDTNLERSFVFGEDRIETYYGYSDKAFYKIRVTKDSGEDTLIDLESDKEVYDISNIIPLGDNKYVLVCSGEDLENGFILDTNALEITEDTTGTYNWANNSDMGQLYCAEDGSNYYSNDKGIFKLDTSTGESEMVVDYNYCGASKSILSYNPTILSIKDDTFILNASSYSNSVYDRSYLDTNMIIELTKADTNPNAGKTILELYSYGGYTENFIYDAISDYNNADNDYYIEFSTRYSVDEAYEDVNWDDMNNEDDYTNLQYGIEAQLSDQLAIDIMNGDGPDILLNTSSLGQLNNPDYLIDLSDKVASYSDADYFTNVINGSFTGDKLYQLPLGFAIVGIQTSGDPGASGVGYTLDEYKDFVDDYCNGKDPRSAGQAYYFVTMFNTMFDTFIKDGNVDFSGEEFAALAEYCKDNVPEKATSWDEPAMDYGMEEIYAQDTQINSMYMYYQSIGQITGAGTGVYGGPSVDGRGPGFSALASIAISAQAIDTDACWDFVSTLLLEEYQEKIVDCNMNPISRAAFAVSAEKTIESAQSEDSSYYYGGSEEYDFKQADADRFEEICNSASYCVTGDASISVILTEEMPSYFSGQKDLAEVVDILQDRVQTVLDERG